MYFIPHRENNDIIIKKKENKPDNINKTLTNSFEIMLVARFKNNMFLVRHDYNQFELIKKNLLNKIYPRGIIK